MPKINEDLRGALEHFLKLLDEEAYFEAHEVLEEAWHALRLRNDPRKSLTRGLINGAIAFAHIKRNRPKVRKQAAVTIGAYERHKAMANEAIDDADLFRKACAMIETLKERYRDYFT